MRVALGVAYDGLHFHGWQKQKNTITVQAVLEDAVSRVANEPVHCQAAGRTDAGVHATGQVVVFETSAERDLDAWRRGVNALTPASINIHWVQVVAGSFHARYSATARRYTYVLDDRGVRDPFLTGRVWFSQTLDADLMHRSAQSLVGEHDFSGFRASGCQSLTPMRRVNFCQVRRQDHLVIIEIEANAFLLHMVRNVVRALHDASLTGDPDHPGSILEGRDRRLLGPTAPPDGLYLTCVSYGDLDMPKALEPSFVTASTTL